MMIDKGVKKIFVRIVAAAICLPFIINGAYGLILNFVPGTMYVNDPDVWTSFLGGFLGAGFTLLGIYWQINESKKDKQSDLIANTYTSYALFEKHICSTGKIAQDFLFFNELGANFESGKSYLINGVKSAQFHMTYEELMGGYISSFKEPIDIEKIGRIYDYLKCSLVKEKLELINCIEMYIALYEVMIDAAINKEGKSGTSRILEANAIQLSGLNLMFIEQYTSFKERYSEELKSPYSKLMEL